MRFTSTAAVALVFAFSTRASSAASILAPGAYVENGHTVYVGVRHYPPAQASNDFFDSASQRTGDLQETHHLHLICGISEQRRLTEAPQGKIGFSLYHVGSVPGATVILVHGNDPEAREMGFIIPFFVCNRINVISYDQRGVGDSAGDWLQNGPVQRAEDIEFLYDDVRKDSHVDAQRIGVWGFSNGGLDRSVGFASSPPRIHDSKKCARGIFAAKHRLRSRPVDETVWRVRRCPASTDALACMT